MRKKYHVTLLQAERKQLLDTERKGAAPAARQTRARILLQANRTTQGLGWCDARIHEALGVAISTVERVRQRFADEGLEAALSRSPSTRRYERLLDGAAEAHLIALACSDPPEGHASLVAAPAACARPATKSASGAGEDDCRREGSASITSNVTDH